MSHKMSLLTAMAVLTLAAGCENRATDGEDKRTDKEKTEALRPSKANAPAVNSIVEARCDRETRCDNVGPEKRFSTRKECVEHVRDKSQNALNVGSCPGGVDAKALGQCLQQIRNEDCGNPLDTFERLAACNRIDLCVASR